MREKQISLLLLALCFLEIGVLLGASQAQSSPDTQPRYKVYYQCNGERVQVDHCRKDDDGQGFGPPTPPERNYCLVYYPDRPRRGGFMVQSAELYGDIVKKLQACGALGGSSNGVNTASAASAGKGSVPSSTATNSGAADLMAQGNKYFAAKDYSRALDAFKKAAALAPSGDAYLDIGLSYYKLNQYPEALSAFQSSARLQPRAVTYKWIGVTLDRQRKYSEALTAIEESVRLEPNADAYYVLGEVYLDLKQWKGAVAAYRESLRLDPNNSLPESSLGFAYMRLEQYADAEAALTQAIRMNPTDNDARYDLAEVYQAQGQFEKAVATLSELIRFNPKNGFWRYTLGEAYLAAGRYPDAIAAYQEAIRLEPSSWQYQRSLGIAYVIEGNKTEAMQVYNRLLNPDKDSAEELLEYIKDPQGPAGALCKLGDMYSLSREDSGKALAAFRNAMRMKPSKVETRSDIGYGLERVGDYDNAMAIFRGIIAAKPGAENLASAYTGIGWIYMDKKEYSKALEPLQQAWKIAPDYLGSDKLGEAYLALKQYDKALASFQEAVKLKPTYDDGFLHIGETYTEEKQYGKALTALKECIRVSNGSLIGYYQMGVVYFQLKQYPDAVVAYQEAIKRFPEYKEAYYGLGSTYRVMGRKPEALKICQTLQALDKDLAQKLYSEINTANN